MRNKKLQGQVTAGRWTLPIVVFICTLCWVLTSFLLPDLTASTVEDSTLSLWQSARDLLLPAWAERLVSYLIYAVIGYSLIELNNRFGIIRMRASMQTAIYFLLVTICPEMHLLYAGDIAALAFLFSIYFLFKSYQQPQAAGYLFYSFLFIGAGSLLFPQLTFLSVLWIFEAHRFQALKPRSFCGALLGWVVPYWFLFGHAFFYNQMELFYRPFTELVTFGKPFDLQILQPWELAVLGYLLVLFIVSAAHCIIAGFEDKIRTRAYLQFLIDLNIFLFLLIALQPTYCVNLLPLLMISSSILIGHFFVLTNSKTSNVFFIISLVSLILLFSFYRLNNTTPHRMGITGIIHLGFTGRQHRAFQFRTGTGGTRQTRPAPYRLPDIRRTRQHGRRNDLLLYGTSGQNKLDREIFQGKERKGRQNGELPARERSTYGIFRLPSGYR